MNASLLTPELVQKILAQYPLPVMGVHGISHWARVLENGLRIAAETGANVRVVQLFAVFHDSRRRNESIDPGHGRRGGKLAGKVRGDWFDLSDQEFELLYLACRDHTKGKTKGDITIQTCWDADRLDLGRVGFIPSPKYLCTEAAKNPETLDWAYQRSLVRYEPELIRSQWGLNLRNGIT